jgi:DNA polymerase elongation subunit (family B)
MNEIYTNIAMRGKYILYRGIDEDGNRFQRKDEFHPTMYAKAKEKTEYRTLDGMYVEPIQAGNIPETRDFLRRYEDVAGFSIYGNTDFIYQFIGSNYRGEIDYDFSKIKVATIDIECESEHGFPRPENANEKINAITVDFNGFKYVFGLGEFNLALSPYDGKLKQFKFETEEDLLESFISVWESESPDIVTGWNVRFFDIPYLVNRITNVLGESDSKRLSPWKFVKERTVRKMNRENQTYEIVGVATLDYYELYQTFTYVNQESYRLDHIAFVELGEKKLSYDEYDSMATFYKNDFQKFIEYNVKDVELVIGLEDKMKLIELAVSLAYAAKVNYNDVFGQVRVWDCIIYHYLMEHNIVIPPKKTSKKDEQYAGAYVKDPITGMHDWVLSFDLNSLYPHLIMQYNISPETKINQQKDYLITPDGILGNHQHTNKGEQSEFVKKALKHHSDNGYSIAANGTCYTKEHQGFLPALMERLYKERKMYKGKMIESQKLQQEIPKMNMPSLGKHALNEKCKKDITKYNNFQLVRKIQLNSAYGAIGNEWFRYFDVDMAEAITLSGQLSIRWIADKLNEFMNKTIGTEDYDYIVASDTDSVYLRCGNLVDKLCGGKTKPQVVDFLDKASEEIIIPFIKKQYDELAKTMNAYENKMVMDRECIADKGVWTAKKRYMMRVHDSEGIRYSEPKLKIMGIETTRSSTPQVVRDNLKEAIQLILTTDEDTVIEFIEDFRNKFLELEPEDIAFPRGVNGMKKYSDNRCIYQKSTPIAVKGSLIYNHYLDKLKLNKRYRKIIDGDKIKFLHLKSPNPLGGIAGTDQVVAFPNSLPREFELEGFIDYDTQFSKSFLEPIKNILEKIGWHHEHVSTLEGFFG